MYKNFLPNHCKMLEIGMEQNHNVPNTKAHLDLLLASGQRTFETTIKELPCNAFDPALLGMSMCAMYQAATCHRGCHGGAHLLESLVGRAYNLCGAAYTLIMQGYYDEALSLTRSVIEINNLVALSVFDKSAHARWLAADKATRLREFSPGAIRKILRPHLPAELDTKDWYADLCEKYVHAHPGTVPNRHDERAHVGGLFQPNGLHKAIEQLSTVAGEMAMLTCKFFRFDDLYDQIREEVRPTN